MKSTSALGICVSAIGSITRVVCAADAKPPQPAPIVLKAAHLFDAVSGKLTDHGVVVVQGKKIVAVGNQAATTPGDSQILDLGDATLLPGFIDAHVHLQYDFTGDFYKVFYNWMTRFPAEQALYGAKYAKETLYAGFTSVRDIESTDYVAVGLRNAINAGVIEGPRMLVSNYAMSSTGGHADTRPFPSELVPPAGPIQGVCNGADQCRAAVRYQLKYGADVIKFMPSGGVLSLLDPVDAPEMTQEEMNAIVAEAHAWGRKVAAHCHGDVAAQMAIKAGADSIEHGTFLTDDTLREMKRRGVYLVPTLYAAYWVGAHADQYPPPVRAKALAAAAQSQAMFQRAVKIGVAIAFGTDSSVEPHGEDAREFALMTQNGMAAAEALMAATSRAADLLGIANATGTLQAGKDADIVALPGNPLTDVHATEHPLLVMKQGTIYRREQLP